MAGNKNSGGNRDPIRRTVLIVQMFNHGNVTVREVENKLCVSRHTAGRLIKEISRVLPIYEVDVLAKPGSPIVYGLIK